MSDELQAPKIDRRSSAEIVTQVEAMLEGLSGGAWRRSPATALDPLGALARIFGDMATQGIAAVNAIPEAALDAFLLLLGVRPQPPGPARVPLTFYLVDKAPDDAVIPAGTRVGATADDDDTSPDEIIFETEDELVVTRTRLIAGYVHDARVDRLDETSSVFCGWTAGDVALFAPRERGVHELYFAAPAALERVGVTSVALSIRLEKDVAIESLPLRWSIWDGAAWQPVEATASRTTISGSHFYVVKIASLPVLSRLDLAGHERAWLRARLDVEPLLSADETSGAAAVAAFPRIRAGTIDAISEGAGIRPTIALRDATKLDPSLDLVPFGEVPSAGTVFYVDGGDALSQAAGTKVTMAVSLALAAQAEGKTPVASADLRLIWELRNDAGGWTEIGRSSGSDDAVGDANPYTFSDGTLALTKVGQVTFTLPASVPEVKVAGQRGRWLRIRLAVGDYGAAERVAYNANSKTWELVQSTLRPPIIEAPVFAFKHEVKSIVYGPSLKGNLGSIVEITDALEAGWVRAFETRPAEMEGLCAEPTVYLAFDRAFPARPIDLFGLVYPPDPADTAPPEEMPSPVDRPRLVWEYLGPRGWTSLGVRDETDALRDRGRIRFVGPSTMNEVELFGRSAHWLRVRLRAGAFRSYPRVGRILLNTTWAAHALTRRLEVLGSSTGAPGQRFQTVAAPVLAGERVEVRERAEYTEYDLQALEAELGAERLTIERRSDGELKAAWIRWLPVASFEAAGADERVYVIDAASGLVTFGDGRHGRVPPKGDANLRMALYRTGGGPRGNRPVGAVNALKTTIRFVDSVANHEAASGGTSLEAAARVRARGPRVLRHRGRAVTAVDFHDLAIESAQEVVRAHVMTAKFNPIDMVVDLSALDSGAQGAPKTDARGWIVLDGTPEDTAAIGARAADVRVIIVPQSDADQPVPSLGLLERVESYLRERCAPPTRLAVSGPRWIKVTARVDLVASADAAADRLSTEVNAAIRRFLHPLTGGELGEGWDFGRIPRRSHLYRLITAIDGVSHIRDLELITDPPLPADTEALSEELRRALTGALIYSGDHEIVLTVPVEEVD
ncbi:MAG: putative baseplate assembly protein [Myxococcales bacterium]|nr:putative baseplate assembly protein [Myxococcales bacterium]